MSQTRILIVDDEATIRALLKCAVAAPGVCLFEADCAEQALHSARGNAPFDLVITDVLMPGMDGVDLAARLRADGDAAKFLFISGYCDLESLEDRLNGLDASFLAKPFSIPELLRVVRCMLDGRRTTQQSTDLRRRASQ
jgi:two-component system cell cycle sensor histidine kinase/response regulator CckA